MSTLCLNMIVKNESKVIRRCLDSVMPYIHSWVIMDTGSTDGTQDLVRGHLASIPGELFERPWTDFGRARTQALGPVGQRADYILFMDADDILECPQDFRFPELDADVYTLDFVMEGGGSRHHYRRAALASTRLRWRFDGVLHECLACDGPMRGDHLAGPIVRASVAGARSADPDKYRKDARILEEALRSEPDNTRYAFYLAQSYRDARMLEDALAAYLKRATMGGWAEEVWYALFEAARIMEGLGRSPAAVSHAYLAAYQARPARGEPLGCLARYHRLREEFHLARLYAAQALAIPRPPDLLFLDESFYHWRSLDEFAVASYWTGHPGDCLAACQRLLTEGHLPAPERPRIEANLRFAREALETRGTRSNATDGGSGRLDGIQIE